jgi:cytochrome c-type biogenesis protein CcmE
MTAQRKQRLMLIALGLLGVGTATALGLTAFGENMQYFLSTSQVREGEAPGNRPFKTGGLVVNGSVERSTTSLDVRFCLSDGSRQLPVEYAGILPDLFSEGQGIIATGQWVNGVFKASQVLAKHDEEYMPPEVAATMKHKGTEGQPHPSALVLTPTSECVRA